MHASRSSLVEAYRLSSRELEGLDRYAWLLEKWNRAINLVSPGSLGDLWGRHYWDSATVFHLADIRRGRWVDLGSGGGFPGLVVAMLARDRTPELRVTCVESDRRKAEFLKTVSRETSTPVDIICDRIERLAPLNADIISARALAALTKLLPMAEQHLKKTGTCLFSKGKTHEQELHEALENWRFPYETVASRTDPEAAILKIGYPKRVRRTAS